MRVFVVLASCMAVVSAAPQSGFASGIAGASAGANALAGPVPVTVERVPAGYTFRTTNTGGANGGVNTDYFPNTGSFGISDANTNANAWTNAVTYAKTKIKPTVVEKSFFYHIAQDDASANTATDTLTITPRKHYKVIFIKAPSAEANAAARALAASRVEEKTIVYVLVNKPVAADANASAIDDSTFKYGKPEVFFIKYQGPQAISKSVASSGADGAVSIAQAGAGAFPVAGVQAEENAFGINGFGGAGAGAEVNAGAISGAFS